MTGKCFFTLIMLVAVFALSERDDNRAMAAEPRPTAEGPVKRLLYVATPGVRDYLEYGGHGLLVFDVDNGHRFVRRIKTAGVDPAGKPLNVKGICASADTARVYVSTIKQLMCLDLVTDELLWERAYEGGCDRMALSPDGSVIYLPMLEGPSWHVLQASNGDVLAKVTPDSGSHNTIYGPSGQAAYLAGLKSPLLTVTDTKSQTIARQIGPFSAAVRPFTIDSRERLCFINANELLGFEVGDLTTGKVLHRVVVEGYEKGPVKRHGCPSHGIGLTPDEREVWLTDGHNQRLHIFDSLQSPPRQVASIKLRDEPGWITFTIAGDYAYPSTGEVIDPRTRQIVTTLKDEEGRAVQSEKMLEIDFVGSKPVRTGNQFGIGRASSGAAAR
jgi:DNA-binding beta-propeller fold protein YncE